MERKSGRKRERARERVRVCVAALGGKDSTVLA